MSQELYQQVDPEDVGMSSAYLRNIDALLRAETGLPVTVCEDPISAVVLGSGRTLDHIELLREVAVT